MNDMETLLSRFDRLEALLGHPVPETIAQPWEHPEVPISQVTAFDGVTIQADGSVWTRALDGVTPLGLIYGYISKAKNPPLWDKMAQILGGEANLQALIDGNGVAARYKLHPEAVVHQGANSFMLLSMLFASPLP